MLRSTRKTEHFRVAKSPEGPWEKILIERPVQRDAKPPRQEGRQIETPEILDAFDSDYEDEYDHSDAVAVSTKPAAPTYGLSVNLQNLQVYCRVSGPYLLIAVAVIAIEFGCPMLHWKSVAYRYMDKTTQKSIDLHCIEDAAICIL